jgi:hypothetical protein
MSLDCPFEVTVAPNILAFFINKYKDVKWASRAIGEK